MTKNSVFSLFTRFLFTQTRFGYMFRVFFAGLLVPFGFAPFHFPGLAILGIAFLYAQLQFKTWKDGFLIGFIFGLGFLGLGVSWVYVSINVYGHLNIALSAFITLLFVVYLSLYTGLFAALYAVTRKRTPDLLSCLLFSALWALTEYLRSKVMGGFPWLLIGSGQIDTPLKYLLPIVGVYGVSFLTCLVATFLVKGMKASTTNRQVWLVAFVGILLLPSILKHTQWTTASTSSISVGVIQANLSMRDKWDESLFWQLLEQYKAGIDQLAGKKNLIVMPESAIPLPANYVSDILDTIDIQGKKSGSAILLGIPQLANNEEENYYSNSVMALGNASGRYFKQHLVPFGEFIPQSLDGLMNLLSLPVTNLKPGKKLQPLILVNEHPIAALICYELAYPQLIRKQLPEAEWIVSVSDDGWFGHSLAMYQQLQIAQVLSLQTGRYQVVANNDGLSSLIDSQGNITASLPAFSAGILEATLYPSTGLTPWVYWGDMPAILLSFLIVLLAIFRKMPHLVQNETQEPEQPLIA